MTLSGGLIAAVALIYMAILFAIAFYGDRSGEMSPRLRAWVYSLSLAVWCTSWTFFGSVGQAAEQLWAFVPIYLGPILLMLFVLAVRKPVRAAVGEALSSGTPLTLMDEKGQSVTVPTSALAYVDIAAEQKGRVGFGG